MSNVLRIDKKYAQSHQQDILESLEHPDQTLQKQTFTLLQHIANPSNAAVICNKLFQCLCRTSSMIVPVFLSHSNNPKKERLVYPMLDTQSDTSFIAEETVQALGLNGQEARLIISTMTSNEKPVSCKRFDRLNIRGCCSKQIISLPAVYSRRSIPANRDHLPS